jgi:plastocyanin
VLFSLLFSLLTEGLAVAGGSVTGQVTLSAKPVGPVIVYIKHIDGVTPATDAESTLSQIDVQFKPGVLVVLAGATVHFPNLDKVWHNVFSLSPGNEFDLGLYRGGTSQSMQLKTPGEVRVYCNIHPQMEATILVLENKAFAEVKPDGSFVIENVPPGNYQLIAWERTHTPMVREILVVEAKATRMDYTLSFNPSSLNHLNKNNEMYGRYQ